MNNMQEIVETLISSAATHKTKIEKLERDLAQAFREIEALRASPLSSQHRSQGE